MVNSVAEPVFLFSSSWRSGSTLLQRFITASGEVLVWGETGGALNALAEALTGWEQITAHHSKRFPGGTGGMGEEAYRQFIASPKEQHAHLWIANLTPPFDEIVNFQRGLLDDLYGKRALEMGYTRWGIKETRCDLATAQTLRTLYPDARFVFLVRDPFDVLLSIKRRNWMNHGPGKATLHYFCEHWRNRSAQFRQADFGFKLRYEDFVANGALRTQLWDYLGISAPQPEDFAANSRVDWETRDTSELTRLERWRIKRWLGGEMAHWGYPL
ncbi:MAG: sulfotransferase [Pseudomonadota bacterium]